MNNAKQTTARLGETGAIGGLGTAESHEQTSIKARPDAFELELIEAFQRAIRGPNRESLC